MTTITPRASMLSPADIEAQSFAIIDAEIPEPRLFSGPAWEIARRLIHTSGDPTLLDHLFLPAAAINAGVAALRAGAPIFTDTRMAHAGIPTRRLDPLGCCATCLLELSGVPEYAQTAQITRSRAAMLLAAPLLPGAVIAIGNAPTALLTLLEILDQGADPPALIIGMPVGFVSAAESKGLLARGPYPSLALLGRKGGSSLAAACVNALLILAQRGE